MFLTKCGFYCHTVYRKVIATLTAGMNDANDINTERVQTRLFEKNDVVIHPCM